MQEELRGGDEQVHFLRGGDRNEEVAHVDETYQQLEEVSMIGF